MLSKHPLGMSEELEEHRGPCGNPQPPAVRKRPSLEDGAGQVSGHTDKGSSREPGLPSQGGFPGSMREQVPLITPCARLGCATMGSMA